MIKIAIDAMGGDYAPQAIVAGAELARDASQNDVEYILFGDQQQIEPLVKNQEHIQIVHADEVIEMDDEPVRAVNKKKRASLVLAAQAVRDGEADLLLSAGNTGALMVAGLLIIGRMRGISRPGLIVTLPVVDNDQGFTMIDAGANADAKVENVLQYAQLGKLYSQLVRKIDNPRIGLINNGTEPDKGDVNHRKMYEELEKMGQAGELNFIGNVEARDLLHNVTDVAVTDGFTGNAALKGIEGSALAVVNMIKDSINDGGIREKLGGLLLKPALKQIAQKMDYTRYGGSVLLGLKAPVIKTHGNSNAKTIFYALQSAAEVANSNLVHGIAMQFHADQQQK
ncbi:phosphate acyltransferase PlsX [Fructilactobacillus cliffordii]|uniref:Phosphate acyltransferase n=1 Tax=Fructilactobacillus cliffordii TaxID=2940299 RepID=A0A9Q8ZUW3_9LACO|nr:phosphate acyltransferase PlsX [Fructilactobacillus cliffordii]USS89687.1 phosphate acyltransferase PlsX [Fructilactobacillus cliffordii]